MKNYLRIFGICYGPAFLVLAVGLTLTGCAPLEQTARDSIAVFKGYLISAQTRHGQECIASNGTAPICDTLSKADYAENAAVTALETYCQIAPGADPATQCKPVKSTAQGLQSALANLNRLSADIKQAAQ